MELRDACRDSRTYVQNRILVKTLVAGLGLVSWMALPAAAQNGKAPAKPAPSGSASAATSAKPDEDEYPAWLIPHLAPQSGEAPPKPAPSEPDDPFKPKGYDLPPDPEAEPTPSPSASAAPLAAPRAVSVAKHKCKPGLVPIPAPTYTNDDENKLFFGNSAFPEDKPIPINAFCIDRTEVTLRAYRACMKAGDCSTTDWGWSEDDHMIKCNAHNNFLNHPANCIYWIDATLYCEAQGLRLPTPEEWEYAARGLDGRLYPWGNTNPSNQLCWNGEGNNKRKGRRQSSCAVGAYPKGRSPFGLEDMAGNVSEWTSTHPTLADPLGGSWSADDPSIIRSANRHAWGHAETGDRRSAFVGFRCVGDPLPSVRVKPAASR